LKTQIETIRGEIRETGESIYTCARLRILCPEVADSGHWNAIARIALSEHWSLTFSPDGSVRFAEF